MPTRLYRYYGKLFMVGMDDVLLSSYYSLGGFFFVSYADVTPTVSHSDYLITAVTYIYESVASSATLAPARAYYVIGGGVPMDVLRVADIVGASAEVGPQLIVRWLPTTRRQTALILLLTY